MPFTPAAIIALASIFGGTQLISLFQRFLAERGQQKLTREGMAVQRKQMKAGAEATREAYKLRKGEKAETWDRIAMEASKGREARGAERQTAMILAALQSMGGQSPYGGGSPTSLVNILRG